MKHFLCLILSALSVCAQTFYVRSGANGTGANWAEAFNSLPSVLQRGATYYIATGTYGTYKFDDPVSGTQLITVKKATATDHGTDSGWMTAYGQGQATWTSLDFDTSYVVFDGMTRNESDWFAGSSYGFKVTGGDQQIRMGHAGKSCSFVQLRNIWLLGSSAPLPSNTIRRYGLDIDTFGGTPSPHGTGCVVARCFFQYGCVPIFSHAQDNMTVEYCAIADNQYNSANHAEGMSCFYTNDRWTIRYNKFKGVRGTAAVAFTHATAGGNQDGFEIYGNVVYDCALDNGSFGFGDKDVPWPYTNTKIYNNTIVNKSGGWSQGIAIESGSNNEAFNNLFINVQSSFWNGPAVAYNKNGYSWSRTETGAILNLQATNIFVNYAGKDFRLRIPTGPGVTLPAPYNKDMLGKTRGVDGFFDIGAYEFAPNITPTNEPPVPTVTNGVPVTIGVSEVTLRWFGSNGLIYTVQYGTNPLSTNWFTLTNIPGVNAYSIYRDAVVTPKRFYRVISR